MGSSNPPVGQNSVFLRVAARAGCTKNKVRMLAHSASTWLRDYVPSFQEGLIYHRLPLGSSPDRAPPEMDPKSGET